MPETEDITAEASQDIAVLPASLISVNRDELALLLAQNAELKADIIKLINVFASFEGLFTGKSVMSAVPVIMKLLNDKSRLAQIDDIIPILHKYTENNG